MNEPRDLKELRSLVDIPESASWETVLLLRAWVAERVQLSRGGEGLRTRGMELVRDLLACRGGVMCSGTADFFSQVLWAFDFFNRRYDYRWLIRGERFSHETNVVMVEGTYYMVDAYLSYHFTDQEGKPLPLLDMLEYIATGAYDKIRRVDMPPVQPKTGMGKGPDGEPKVVTRIMSIPAFLLSNRRMAQFRKVFGDRPMDELLLDMILINPHLESAGPDELDAALARLGRTICRS